MTFTSPPGAHWIRRVEGLRPFSLLIVWAEGPASEEEMPDVEIDIDDLLDADSEEERALKLREALVDCHKPTEEFIKELLSRIRGMRKLSPPQKKTV
ncbi:Protein phosphatase 1 regulatory subunit 14C [Myotis brandtii]|uniref:Protein phosphatase 1 regulatory subunit 14 n=1 Tax=Myotis brandtii TaxID=109478 RepID=S7NR73_MYOBR|nr:Protein phosphatase 1 regulatory subunit 14C [Myotis brandtii]